MVGEIGNALGLGEPYHIGIATRDIEKAMTRLDELLGIGPGGRIDAEVDAVFRGSQTISGVRSAFARLGPMYLELVEPTLGDFPAKTFLEEHGEGIYHMGYWVEDIGSSIQKAERVGLSVEWAFPSERPQVVYLDSTSSLGMHIEFVHPGMREGIERAIARAVIR